MTVPVHRRTSFSRAVVALGGVALLALLALAAVLLGGALTGQSRATGPEGRAVRAVVVGEHDLAVAPIHAIHAQPSLRTRGVAFAVLASVAIAAAWASRRLRLRRTGRLRTSRVAGLPPGRAPPALRIA
jgi:hypothetical protein